MDGPRSIYVRISSGQFLTLVPSARKRDSSLCDPAISSSDEVRFELFNVTASAADTATSMCRWLFVASDSQHSHCTLDTADNNSSRRYLRIRTSSIRFCAWPLRSWRGLVGKTS